MASVYTSSNKLYSAWIYYIHSEPILHREKVDFEFDDQGDAIREAATENTLELYQVSMP